MFAALSGITGCGRGIMTLKHLSSAQAEIKRGVNEARKDFARLIADIDGNKIPESVPREKFIGSYGPPVLEEAAGSGVALLYRDPLKFSGTKKVYVFFDGNGLLTDLRVEE